MYSDLDEFLSDLDTRGLLTRIAEPVSPNLEIAAVIDRACKTTGGGPALVFERPTGFDIPVAANVFGSMERMCLALGVKSLDDLGAEIDELMTPPAPKGLMKDAQFDAGKAYYLGDFFAEGTVSVLGRTRSTNWRIKTVKNDYGKTTADMKALFQNLAVTPTEDRMIGKPSQ